MPAYQLQIKQVVDYPRCRIYRQFIHRLIDDRSIRASGGSGLFHYTVLCSFANFRTSYRRIDGISYTVYPGEWVCTLKELSQWFRTRFQCQALSILGELQQRHLIDFSSLGRGNVIRYKIRNWARHNTVLEYNAPCQKDTGFFFLPVSIVTDLISSDRCSEMDIVLDLWVSAIYNDSQVQGSGLGPVAYFRNGTGNPLVTYTELAARWGLSRATVGRILKKLSALDYCAARDEDFESISLDDLAAVLRDNKEHLYSYTSVQESREVTTEDPETGEETTTTETWIIYTIRYNGESYLADHVFALTDEQKKLASDYASNLSTFLGDGLLQNMTEWTGNSIPSLGDVTFTDGVTPVVYYNQLDERYASQPYGTDNIGG